MSNSKQLHPKGSDCVVSWTFGLGMHLFRQAERETLRVRKADWVRRESCDDARRSRTKVRNVKASGEMERGKEDFLVGNSPKVPAMPFSGCPFNHPRRSARSRRMRRKNPTHMAKADKNPVKVTVLDVKKSVKPKPIGIAGLDWEFGKKEIGLLSRESQVRSRRHADDNHFGLPERLWTCSCCPSTYDTYRWAMEADRLKRLKAYRREGGNRKEKRRDWFTNQVVKKLSAPVTMIVGKKSVGYVKRRFCRVGKKGYCLLKKEVGWLRNQSQLTYRDVSFYSGGGHGIKQLNPWKNLVLSRQWSVNSTGTKYRASLRATSVGESRSSVEWAQRLFGRQHVRDVRDALRKSLAGKQKAEEAPLEESPKLTVEQQDDETESNLSDVSTSPPEAVVQEPLRCPHGLSKGCCLSGCQGEWKMEVKDPFAW